MSAKTITERIKESAAAREAAIKKHRLENEKYDTRHRISWHIDWALWAANQDALRFKIKQCRKGKFCSSVYCPTCRKRAQENLRRRIFDHCEQQFNGDEEKAQKRLRYLTVLCELCEIDQELIEQSVKNARKDLHAFKRRFRDVWAQGSFEYEVVDMNHLESAKKQTLMRMKKNKDQYQVLVHCHLLVDIGSEDDLEMKKWLKKKWKGERRTELKRTFCNQTIKDKSKKIGNYGFKNRVRFNPSFVATDFENGDTFNYYILSKLVTLYDHLGGNGFKGLLIGMK